MNKQDAIIYTVDDEAGTMKYWSDKTGIHVPTLHYRVITKGMTMKQAIAKKVRVYADSDLKAKELSTPADAHVLVLVWNNLIMSMSEQEAFKRIGSYV
jgi:hypothetical protein